jgi:hypothetical protein
MLRANLYCSQMCVAICISQKLINYFLSDAFHIQCVPQRINVQIEIIRLVLTSTIWTRCVRLNFLMFFFLHLLIADLPPICSAVRLCRGKLVAFGVCIVDHLSIHVFCVHVIIASGECRSLISSHWTDMDGVPRRVR